MEIGEILRILGMEKRSGLPREGGEFPLLSGGESGEKHDARVNEIQLLFESPEIYTDAAGYKALSEELAGLTMRSRERVIQWEALLHQLEEVTAT